MSKQRRFVAALVAMVMTFTCLVSTTFHASAADYQPVEVDNLVSILNDLDVNPINFDGDVAKVISTRVEFDRLSGLSLADADRTKLGKVEGILTAAETSLINEFKAKADSLKIDDVNVKTVDSGIVATLNEWAAKLIKEGDDSYAATLRTGIGQGYFDILHDANVILTAESKIAVYKDLDEDTAKTKVEEINNYVNSLKVFVRREKITGYIDFIAKYDPEFDGNKGAAAVIAMAQDLSNMKGYADWVKAGADGDGKQAGFIADNYNTKIAAYDKLSIEYKVLFDKTMNEASGYKTRAEAKTAIEEAIVELLKKYVDKDNANTFARPVFANIYYDASSIVALEAFKVDELFTKDEGGVNFNKNWEINVVKAGYDFLSADNKNKVEKFTETMDEAVKKMAAIKAVVAQNIDTRAKFGEVDGSYWWIRWNNDPIGRVEHNGWFYDPDIKSIVEAHDKARATAKDAGYDESIVVIETAKSKSSSYEFKARFDLLVAIRNDLSAYADKVQSYLQQAKDKKLKIADQKAITELYDNLKKLYDGEYKKNEFTGAWENYMTLSDLQKGTNTEGDKYNGIKEVADKCDIQNALANLKAAKDTIDGYVAEKDSFLNNDVKPLYYDYDKKIVKYTSFVTKNDEKEFDRVIDALTNKYNGYDEDLKANVKDVYEAVSTDAKANLEFVNGIAPRMEALPEADLLTLADKDAVYGVRDDIAAIKAWDAATDDGWEVLLNKRLNAGTNATKWAARLDRMDQLVKDDSFKGISQSIRNLPAVDAFVFANDFDALNETDKLMNQYKADGYNYEDIDQNLRAKFEDLSKKAREEITKIVNDEAAGGDNQWDSRVNKDNYNDKLNKLSVYYKALDSSSNLITDTAKSRLAKTKNKIEVYKTLEEITKFVKETKGSMDIGWVGDNNNTCPLDKEHGHRHNDQICDLKVKAQYVEANLGDAIDKVPAGDVKSNIFLNENDNGTNWYEKYELIKNDILAVGDRINGIDWNVNGDKKDSNFTTTGDKAYASNNKETINYVNSYKATFDKYGVYPSNLGKFNSIEYMYRMNDAIAPLGANVTLADKKVVRELKAEYEANFTAYAGDAIVKNNIYVLNDAWAKISTMEDCHSVDQFIKDWKDAGITTPAEIGPIHIEKIKNLYTVDYEAVKPHIDSCGLGCKDKIQALDLDKVYAKALQQEELYAKVKAAVETARGTFNYNDKNQIDEALLILSGTDAGKTLNTLFDYEITAAMRKALQDASAAINEMGNKIDSAISSIGDDYDVDMNTTIISRISGGTTVEAFLAKAQVEGVTVEVTAANVNDALVGTGSVLTFKDGDKVLAQFTLSVTGDIDGDGETTVTDALIIRDNDATMIDSIEKTLAADTSGNGKITEEDYTVAMKLI